MQEEYIPYIRVGTTYFKRSNFPTSTEETTEILLPWRLDIIKQDEGRNYIAQIPKYDGFVCIPSHIDYQRDYKKYYNTYHPLSRQPEEGSVSTTIYFLQHIFGEQIEYGLDYLQLLYLNPKQILPILCLVSKERATGKSTFLKWINLIFEKNLTYITNQNFSSQFNSDWASKLLICIDEVLFNKEELTERIKYLSTTNINKLEAKGKDRVEVEFFGKFILCSNNETNFIKIDSHEIRFWVRKIPSIKREDTNILAKLKKEIPAFLYYLKYRKMRVVKPLSRMWFTSKQLHTKALDRLVSYAKNPQEVSIVEVLFDIFQGVEDKCLYCCPNDVEQLILKVARKHITTIEIRRTFKSWKLTPANNTTSYCTYTLNSNGFVPIKKRGRYYSIQKLFVLQKYDALM